MSERKIVVLGETVGVRRSICLSLRRVVSCICLHLCWMEVFDLFAVISSLAAIDLEITVQNILLVNLSTYCYNTFILYYNVVSAHCALPTTTST